ncbi:MAG: ferrous iron transport protein A [Bacteroidetes bacterium]|nr:ferrous iron transport protein A [Bacteroidota bacterium]
MEVLLSEIFEPTKLIITRILSSDLEAKFTEMGLVSNKEIEWLFCAPLKDPIAIEVDDCTLSLRRDEAQFIVVHKI